MNVIIPTRERADTLMWTLKTCGEQDYENLNIIVCDNFSNDNTEEVVKSFKDNRITYINTGRRLSMTQNWNHALSYVSDGYVTILGDDDGLLPESINKISAILSDKNISAFSWLKADYSWPNHINHDSRNNLSIPLEQGLIDMPAKKVLRDASLYLLSYSRTPTLYNSFVDYRVIESVRKKSGTVLRSAAPDVYSGIALLSEIENYLISMQPYSVNGASSHSNGTSTRSTANKDAANKYQSELRPEETEQLGLVFDSIFSVVGESIFQANKYCFGGKLMVSKRLTLFLILLEMAKRGEHGFDNSREDINRFVKRHNLSIFYKVCMLFINPKKLKKSNKPVFGFSRPGVLSLNAEKFNVSNIYDACNLVNSFLSASSNLEIRKYSSCKIFFQNIFTKIKIGADNITL